MLPGRTPVDAVWRAQVRAFSLDEDEQVLELSWDVQKCFENVNRRLLIKLALDAGYPAKVLRLSLASYGWGRRLRGDYGIVTQLVWATCMGHAGHCGRVRLRHI